jgi:hypothetical protein
VLDGAQGNDTCMESYELDAEWRRIETDAIG